VAWLVISSKVTCNSPKASSVPLFLILVSQVEENC